MDPHQRHGERAPGGRGGASIAMLLVGLGLLALVFGSGTPHAAGAERRSAPAARPGPTRTRAATRPLALPSRPERGPQRGLLETPG